MGRKSYVLSFYRSATFNLPGVVFLLSFSFLLTGISAQPNRDSAKTITINAIGGLQYDLVRFSVKPGSEVKLILTNKDDMKHNMLITVPGARMAVVNASLQMGNMGEKKSYIPAMDEILWSIPLLEPGESKTLSFTAPQKEGVYPYVCTYPGHGQVMYGAMYVTRKEMPPLKDDIHVPPVAGAHKGDVHIHDNKDFAEQKRAAPYLYRIFLPGASPAAIAVRLSDSLSYCWDAGTCRLRYAWYGGFLDNTDIWKGHHDAYGTIMGTIFYRDKTNFPIHIDHPGNIPVVQFKGYRLVNKYPEFHYTLDGIDVYELIKPGEKGVALIRTFRVPQTERILWFLFDNDDGVSYQASKGDRQGNKVRLSPSDAKEFTITMAKN